MGGLDGDGFAVARADLDGLAFRDGYAPWPPFSGALQPIRDGWARRNARRLPALKDAVDDATLMLSGPRG